MQDSGCPSLSRTPASAHARCEQRSKEWPLGKDGSAESEADDRPLAVQLVRHLRDRPGNGRPVIRHSPAVVSSCASQLNATLEPPSSIISPATINCILGRVA